LDVGSIDCAVRKHERAECITLELDAVRSLRTVERDGVGILVWVESIWRILAGEGCVKHRHVLETGRRRLVQPARSAFLALSDKMMRVQHLRRPEHNPNGLPDNKNRHDNAKGFPKNTTSMKHVNQSLAEYRLFVGAPHRRPQHTQQSA
jgi:hypothetical protein